MVFLTSPTLSKSKGQISDESRAVFGSATSPTWCQQILADSSLTPIEMAWRRPHDRNETTQNSFLSGTMCTSDTIHAWHTVYRPGPSHISATATQQAADDDRRPLSGEVICLIALGSGVNSHENVTHGGVTATIIDASMATTAHLFSSQGGNCFTLELTVRYKKMMVTPAIYMTRTWLERRTKGRKAWLQSVVEDGNGAVLAEAEALFLEGETVARL